MSRSILGAALAMVLLAVPASAGRPAPGFAWPLAGTPELGRAFAPPASAWGAGHRGVDLLADAGAPVLAAGSGTVTYAGLLAGRGVVTVTHAGGLRTTYEPVDAVVDVGDRVVQGDLLGLLGAGHGSCPPGRACLHWGLLRGSTYLDPLLLVDPGSPRLLPTTDRSGRAVSVASAAEEGARRLAPERSRAPQVSGARRPEAARPGGEAAEEGSSARALAGAGALLAAAGALAASRRGA